MAQRGTRRLFGLAIATAAWMALPSGAGAQETQRSDSVTQDTSQVQNPPGYRGMERPVNVFPPDSGADTMRAGRVEDRATGTYDDSTWQDTSGAAQNPAGYRGMERPAGQDTSAAGAGGDTRLQPTDSAGTPGEASAAPGDTGSVAGHKDSASVLPGGTEPMKADKPSRRLSPTDSAGADTGGQQSR